MMSSEDQHRVMGYACRTLYTSYLAEIVKRSMANSMKATYSFSLNPVPCPQPAFARGCAPRVLVWPQPVVEVV